MNDSNRGVSARWWLACGVVLVILNLGYGLRGLAFAEEGSHLLDGKSFVGKNGEKGKALADYEDEEITFVNGMFTSLSCVPYNFGSSPYRARVIDGKVQFDAVTFSPTHGKIAWSGVIDGDTADVVFVWTKERWYWDIHREYWFRGTLKH